MILSIDGRSQHTSEGNKRIKRKKKGKAKQQKLEYIYNADILKS